MKSSLPGATARRWHVVFVGVVLALPAAWASAHPGLLSSLPPDGAALDAAPKQIRLRFNEPVEPAFTTLKLVDASGHELANATSQGDKTDERTVNVPVPELRPGAYQARWSALGRDGHRVKGSFGFSVK